MHVSAHSDDRAAGERPRPAERLTLRRELPVLALAVSGLALADLLVAPGVERRALLLRPRALSVLAAEGPLDVEDGVARRTHVEPQRVRRLDAHLVTLRLRDEVDVVDDVGLHRLRDGRMHHVEHQPGVRALHRHPVAARERRDGLFLTRCEERAAAVFGLREPGAVVEVHLLDRWNGAVGADEVRPEARDVAVDHRLLDRHRVDEHVVLAGLHGDRPEREPHALARAGVADVIRALPAFGLVEPLLVGVVALVRARARQRVDADRVEFRRGGAIDPLRRRARRDEQQQREYEDSGELRHQFLPHVGNNPLPSVRTRT